MIKKYIGKELIADGYERWIRLTSNELNTSVWAHYIAEDYLEPNHSLISDQYIEGEIYIDLVVNDEEVYGTGFEQPISNSSHIVAYAKVFDVSDEFSALCEVEGFLDLLKIEFERKFELKAEQKLKVIGSLELELI